MKKKGICCFLLAVSILGCAAGASQTVYAEQEMPGISDTQDTSGTQDAGTQIKKTQFKFFVELNGYLEYEVTQEQFFQIETYHESGSEETLYKYLKSIIGEEFMPKKLKELKMMISCHRSVRESPKSSASESGALGGEKASAKTDDFMIAGGVLYQYCGEDEIVVIPNTVTRISQGSFYNNPHVKAIVVPKSVKIIDSLAFCCCSRLQTIFFGGECRKLGEYMLFSCDRFTNFAAPEKSREYKYAAKHLIPVFSTKKRTLGTKKMYFMKGDSQKLQLYNNLDAVKWKSSRPSVVSVSRRGKISCKKEGTAKITATAGGTSCSLIVSVSKQSEKKRVRQIIRTVVKEGMSDREKVKVVHDWLVEHVKYDYDSYLKGAVPQISHTSAGALIRGIAVCDGYAKAFQKVMKELGISCDIVNGHAQGAGHAWNRVKLSGTWYHVDVTFDDPVVNGKNTNTKPHYTYFLKTSKQMKRQGHVF